MDVVGEIEMRVEEARRPDGLARIEAAIRSLDPDATVRLDPATGIVHARTSRETLEVVDVLGRAGLTATAMTG
ncbi:MAG: hypothetical protein JWR08_1361 [Enterovirga sp.]|jgi:hypothetical protein|nr:hypothetical protein [Enterovirga sp.]